MKQGLLVGCGLVALVLITSSCVLNSHERSPGPMAVTGDDMAGRELFQQYCGSCHGASGVGDGPVSQLLKKRPPDLTTFAERREGKFSYTELANYIDGRKDVAAHGSRIMPVWGQEFGRTLSDADVRQGIVNGNVLELVLYLESIQQ